MLGTHNVQIVHHAADQILAQLRKPCRCAHFSVADPNDCRSEQRTAGTDSGRKVLRTSRWLGVPPVGKKQGNPCSQRLSCFQPAATTLLGSAPGGPALSHRAESDTTPHLQLADRRDGSPGASEIQALAGHVQPASPNVERRTSTKLAVLQNAVHFKSKRH
jgi:hypothetical protein